MALLLVLSRKKLSPGFLLLTLSALVIAIAHLLLNGGSYVCNIAISLLFVLSASCLMFSRALFDLRSWQFWLKTVSILMAANGTVGTVQFLMTPTDPDSFIGLFGRHGEQMHTLAIIYGALAALHFSLWRIDRNRSNFSFSIFFLYGMLMCSYNACILIFALSAILANVRWRRLPALIGVLIIGFGSLTLYANVNKTNFFYLDHMLTQLVETSQTAFSSQAFDLLPRKFILFTAYPQMIGECGTCLLIGAGPGMYNSRTSFLLNGDYSSYSVLPVSRPPLAERYVYPLWNSYLLSEAFMDGTANQPFSSIMAIVAEYGLVFFVLVVIVWFTSFKRLGHVFGECSPKLKALFDFIMIYMAGMALVNNILEYPELVLTFFGCIQYMRAQVEGHHPVRQSPQPLKKGLVRVG